MGVSSKIWKSGLAVIFILLQTISLYAQEKEEGKKLSEKEKEYAKCIEELGDLGSTQFGKSLCGNDSGINEDNYLTHQPVFKDPFSPQNVPPENILPNGDIVS